MRDTLGGRPYDVKMNGSKHTLNFYPLAKNAKNPDVVLFRLTLIGDELKKLAKITASSRRSTIGGRPYDVKKYGSNFVLRFYPHAENAKNPDAVRFRLTLTGDELKKLAKITN